MGAGFGWCSSELESSSSFFMSISMPVAAGVAGATGERDELAESISLDAARDLRDSRLGDEGSN